jgi:hypothetical protein
MLVILMLTVINIHTGRDGRDATLRGELFNFENSFRF